MPRPQNHSVDRFSVSLDAALLAELDRMVLERKAANRSQAIADELISAKGVKHGKLTITTTGKDLEL